MNAQHHVKNYLSIKPLEVLQQEFNAKNVVYLSVYSHLNLAGYIILVKGEFENTIQFKRILIDERYLGIGEDAIAAMENYCMTELKAKRIWLDVFEDNNRAIQCYKKCGYQTFKQAEENGKAVIFYEKSI